MRVWTQDESEDLKSDGESDEDVDDIEDDQSFASIDDLEGEWHELIS